MLTVPTCSLKGRSAAPTCWLTCCTLFPTSWTDTTWFTTQPTALLWVCIVTYGSFPGLVMLTLCCPENRLTASLQARCVVTVCPQLFATIN